MQHARRKPGIHPRRHELARAVMMALAMVGALSAATAQSAAVYPLSGLNGANGVRLDGVSTEDYSGRSVAAAGDVNGDGIADVIVGARRADPFSIGNSGASYVVFGRSTAFASTINLSSLDGTTGFRLDGVNSGPSVAAAGDVNGDGIGDIIVGVGGAHPNGSYSGASYVVFGRSTAFAPTINLSSLDGATGFRLAGVAMGDFSGSSVSAAGDVNGDGIDDVIIGADGAAPNGIGDSGASYVVFGRSTAFASTINLSSLDGTTGFRLDGVAAYDRSGRSVAAAGDVNGDGIADVIVGAVYADPNGSSSGASYVVFGRSTAFAPTINLSSLDGATGFRLDGVAMGDFSGRSVSAAGDVNGDGIADVIIGASGADPNGSSSGASYVVFGRSTAFASTINLSSLDGATGFRLDGGAVGDFSGISVAGAGDVNGDAIADIIVGAYGADPNGSTSGASYVVFGRSSGFDSAINLGGLNGAMGFQLDGTAPSDSSGQSVAAAGDLNGDGIGDVIVGAREADPNGSNSGSSYVVFGNAAPLVSNGGPAQLPAVLEDTPNPSGTRLDTAALPFYLDLDPLAGAGLTSTPTPSDGAWQYSLDAGATWQVVPAGLSTANALVLLSASQLRFVPGLDFFGNSPTLSLRLWDGADAYTAGEGRNISASVGSRGGFSNDTNLLGTVAPITPVNDAPAFTATNPPPVNEDAGAQSVPNVASSFSPGPANESAQTLAAYLVANVIDAALFSTQPAVASEGTLTYTPGPNAFGTATFELRVQDSGGTPGVDTSAPQTVTITLAGINDAPSFTAIDPAPVRNDAGAVQITNWVSAFDPGPAEGEQAIQSFVVSNVTNASLFATLPQVLVDRTLQFEPAAGAAGTSQFTVTVQDNGGAANGGVDTSVARTFAIAVRATVVAVFANGFEG